MAAIKYIKRTVALDGNSVSDVLPESLFDGEQTAHMFIIAAVRDGESLALSGAVTGIFLNANDQQVPLTGSVTSGAATLTLSNACYHVTGRFTLTISVAGAVVYKATGRISRRSSTTAYDPSGIIPNLDEIQAEIAAMRTATANANTAYNRLINYAPSVEGTTLILPT